MPTPISPEQDELIARWAYNGRNQKEPFIHGFARGCAVHAGWNSILYIVKIIEEKNVNLEERAEIFYRLRAGNLANPRMSWPYLAIASEGSLAYMRLVVPKLQIWDFRTGKKLSK